MVETHKGWKYYFKPIYESAENRSGSESLENAQIGWTITFLTPREEVHTMKIFRCSSDEANERAKEAIDVLAGEL
ncbi:hypothetical protein NG798_23345 [Ancylothrix sp. C2]|uniref:hypothetical protein n=1 Tax=Ancylothrix sp. D3o TaxID=2953691 RepID=UPI0021BAB491|nr:hypothetical protein [Ancylothrix sp. D3o]MCT7952740.1 hypothetical protein [Ancylothrix sp. D3o]